MDACTRVENRGAAFAGRELANDVIGRQRSLIFDSRSSVLWIIARGSSAFAIQGERLPTKPSHLSIY
jgi:hypothetical protein